MFIAPDNRSFLGGGLFADMFKEATSRIRDYLYHIQDELLMDREQFIQYATEKFLLMKPFNQYLNRALDGFTMPKR